MQLVRRVVERTHAIRAGYDERLTDREQVLSLNKVCGWSLNFPIAMTCAPTKVCVNTCYFAKSGTAWPASLKKQLRLYNSTVADPVNVARRIAAEYERHHLTFLRWNGGGDLFTESVEAINHLGRHHPTMVLWVVTRHLDLAAKIGNYPNVYIHISIDRTTMHRIAQYERMLRCSNNYLYSYQADKNESIASLEGISVLFYDRYIPNDQLPQIEPEVVCPLNTEEDISGACESCRRCFDGSAVKHRTRGGTSLPLVALQNQFSF